MQKSQDEKVVKYFWHQEIRSCDGSPSTKILLTTIPREAGMGQQNCCY